MYDKFLRFKSLLEENSGSTENLLDNFLPNKKKFTPSHKGFFVLCTLLLLAVVVSNIPAIMSVNSRVGNRELPIYCVQTDKKQIALSFDAAWGNEDTQKILEILKKHDIKVTFFMTGGWVESYPDDVKSIYAA